MSFDYWDPFQRLEEFRRDSSRMFDQLMAHLPDSGGGQEAISFHPEVDLVESSKEFRFYLSIPGMVEDDIMIEIDGRNLTIRGERRPPYDPEQRNPQVTEWRYGVFVRQFELSAPVAVNRVHAVYDAGVLTIVAEKLLDETDDLAIESDEYPRLLRDDEGQG
jgi:HSP20 family protein